MRYVLASFGFTFLFWGSLLAQVFSRGSFREFAVLTGTFLALAWLTACLAFWSEFRDSSK